MQIELLGRAIVFKHLRPYHPQTCGRVERFHQTLKLFLAKQPASATIEECKPTSICSSPTTTSDRIARAVA